MIANIFWIILYLSFGLALGIKLGEDGDHLRLSLLIFLMLLWPIVIFGIVIYGILKALSGSSGAF